MADFTSFVNLDDSRPHVTSTHNIQPSASFAGLVEGPPLLLGEIESSVCENVSFWMQFRGSEYGRVSCSKVRIRFTPTHPSGKNLPRRSRFFDDFYDIPLCCIARILVSLVKSSNTEKFETMSRNMSSMEVISMIRIELKDMRTATIDLRQSQNGTHLANQIFFFAQCGSIDTMTQVGAAHKNRGHQTKLPFNGLEAWQSELRRCAQSTGTGGGAVWRVCALHREGFSNTAQGYPMYVVVPAFLSTGDIDRLMATWKLGRIPVWTWSRASGNAALLISANHENNLATPELNAKMIESVMRCHLEGERPYSLHLDGNFVSRVAKSYDLLLDLCVSDSYDKVASDDKDWFKRVNKTEWLQLLRECLVRTDECIKWIVDRDRSVIVSEEEGRDMAIVVASLTQLCCDAYYRTTTGFQHLIEKMWISLGHPFGQRLLGRRDGSAPKTTMTTRIEPTWLIFLDCCAQLLRIYPIEFNFSHYLLISLWDLSLTGLVPAFACNGIEEQLASRVGGGPFPVDDYCTEEFVSMFGNAYKDALIFADALKRRRGVSLSSQHLHSDVIRPPTALCDVELWNDCYLRWLPAVNLINGGAPADLLALDDAMCELATSYGAHWRRRARLPDSFSSAFPFSAAEPVILDKPLTPDDSTDDVISRADDSISVVSMSALNMTPDRRSTISIVDSSLGSFYALPTDRSPSVRMKASSQSVSFSNHSVNESGRNRVETPILTPTPNHLFSPVTSTSTNRGRGGPKPTPPPRPHGLTLVQVRTEENEISTIVRL